jgi:hypothetical protein
VPIAPYVPRRSGRGHRKIKAMKISILSIDLHAQRRWSNVAIRRSVDAYPSVG